VGKWTSQSGRVATVLIIDRSLGDLLKRIQIPSLRWIIAGLLFVETLLAYLDLQALSVLAPMLRQQLDIGDSRYAFITQGFLLAYTLTFCVGGFFVDKLGVRNGLALCLVATSVTTGCHAMANTSGELAFWRFLMGLSYPGIFLAAARTVSEWYPVQERAFVYGLYVSGATAGAIVAYPLVVWMTLKWSWRGPFVIMGVVGLLVSALWFLLYRRPDIHPWVTEKEREYVRTGRIQEDPASIAGFTWKNVIKTRPFWAVAIGRLIADSTWMFYVLWLAKFLVEEHGMKIEDVGRYGWIPWAFANVGGVAGGWCSGQLIRRGIEIRIARLIVLGICAGVRAFTFLLGIPMPTPVLLTFVGVLMMCTSAWQVNLSVMNVDNYPARLVSTVAGVTTSFGTFSSVFFQSVVAWFLLNYSYRPVFVLISVLSVTAYIVVHLIVRHAPKPLTTELEATGSAG